MGTACLRKQSKHVEFNDNISVHDIPPRTMERDPLLYWPEPYFDPELAEDDWDHFEPYIFDPGYLGGTNATGDKPIGEDPGRDVHVRRSGTDPAKETNTEKTLDIKGESNVPTEKAKTSGDETIKKNQTLESSPIKPTKQPKSKGDSGTKSSMTDEKLKMSEDNTNKTEKGPVKESNMSQKISKNIPINSNVNDSKSSATPKNQNIAKTSREPSPTKRDEKTFIPRVSENEIRTSDNVYSTERKDELSSKASPHRETPAKFENKCVKKSDSNITKVIKDDTDKGYCSELDRDANSNKGFSEKKSVSDTHITSVEMITKSKTVSEKTPSKTTLKQAAGNKPNDASQDKKKQNVTVTLRESHRKTDISVLEKTQHESIPQHYSVRGRALAPTPSVIAVHTSTGIAVRNFYDKTADVEPGMVDRKPVLRKQPSYWIIPRKHGRRRKHSASRRSRSSQRKSLEQRRQHDKSSTEASNIYPHMMYHDSCALEREVKVIPSLQVLEAHPVNEPSLGGHSRTSLVSKGTVLIDSYSNIQNSKSGPSNISTRVGVVKSDQHVQEGGPHKRSPNPRDSAQNVLRPCGLKDVTSQERIWSANDSRQPSETQLQRGGSKASIGRQDVDRTGSSATKVKGRYDRGPRASQRTSVNLSKRIRK